MKKTISLLALATTSLTIIACLFKLLHFPGAGLLLLTSGILFCLVFIPLLIVYLFQHEKVHIISKINYSLGLTMGTAFILSIIFKIMKLAYVNILMQGSISILLYVVVPTYFATIFNKKVSGNYSSEERLHRIVAGMIVTAFFGMLYSLIDLS
jgi:hypothetical protein